MTFPRNRTQSRLVCHPKKNKQEREKRRRELSQPKQITIMPRNLTKQLKGKYFYLLNGVNLRWLAARLLIIGLCIFIFALDITYVHKSKPSVTDWPRAGDEAKAVKLEISTKETIKEGNRALALLESEFVHLRWLSVQLMRQMKQK